MAKPLYSISCARSPFMLLLQRLWILALFLLLPTASDAEQPDSQQLPKHERGLIQRAPKFKPSSYAEFPDVQSLPERESALCSLRPQFHNQAIYDPLL